MLLAFYSFVAFGQGVDISYEDRKSTAITVGVLNGGGLLGAELTTMLSRKVSGHIGLGFVGACIGVNLHTRPTVASSSITFEIRSQGVAEIYTDTSVGLGYTLRYKSLAMQLGAAYRLDKGPNTIKNWNTRSVIPQISLGYFNPF